jgi:hypothetical protein
MTQIIDGVAILELFLIAYHPPIRLEVLLAFASLAECLVSMGFSNLEGVRGSRQAILSTKRGPFLGTY